jgi:dGTPase
MVTRADRTPDTRSSWEHDADRILYSDAYRRLSDVTQVVAVGENSLFHTRLTHTEKVAQIARRLAQHLTRVEDNDATIENLGGLNPEAAYAAGLAHDLGHPPFGHVGEEALNERCQAYKLDGYEGNAQTFRLVTKLVRGGNHDTTGLDLTPETLNGILKYPWRRTGDRADAKKWNAYLTEEDAFKVARGDRFAQSESQSLEAAVMDLADDITYAVHDLEDFIRAGRIPVAALIYDGQELSNFTGAASAQIQRRNPSWGFDPAFGRSLFHGLFTGVLGLSAFYRGTLDERAAVQQACGRLIGRFVSAARLGDVEKPIRIPRPVRHEIEMLKQLTWYYVIHDPALATMQEGQKEVITELFEQLMEWIPRARKGAEEYRLPTYLRELWAFTDTETGVGHYPDETARRARAVADYISSLTERQVEDLHGRLSGRPGQSVLDPWMRW